LQIYICSKRLGNGVDEVPVAYLPFTDNPLGDIAREVMQRSIDPRETAPHTKARRQSRVMLRYTEHTLRILGPFDCLDLSRVLYHGLEPAKGDPAAAGGRFNDGVCVNVYPVVGCL